MSRTELDRTVQPSLLDRLTDEDPRDSADRAVSREASTKAFRMAVQLWNTRRSIVPVSAAHPELRRSVHEFGLPDTSGISMATGEGRQQLTDDIADTVRRFEPRLMNVAVRLLDADQVKAPQVRFAVEATLRMDPSPERIVFDTVLEIASGTYAVDDAS